MQPRILLDSNTPINDIMYWINLGVTDAEKAERCSHVIKRIPQLIIPMKLYFGDKEYQFSQLGTILIDYKIKENGIKDRLNFSVFFKDIDLYSDNTVLSESRLISKVLSILDYTIMGDIEFIKQVIYLQQIEMFDEFGIEAYNVLMENR